MAKLCFCNRPTVFSEWQREPQHPSVIRSVIYTFNTCMPVPTHAAWCTSQSNVFTLMKGYHFVSLPSFLYFLFTFNTVYTASHHWVMSLLWWRALAQIIGNLFYHFDSLPSFLYFLFTFNTVYAASMSLLWWRTSAQNVRNSFYHFDSLPSFLYFLSTFNTVYTASHYTTDTTIVLVKRFGSNKTRLNPLIWHKKNMHVIHFFFVNVFLRKWTLICTVF